MASFADISIRFGADIKGFSSDMQNAQRQLKKTASTFRKIGAGLTVAVSAPLLAIGSAAVKTFTEFEQELAKVKAISGATEPQFKRLEKLALDLGASTRFAASEVAALELNLSKLGFSPREIEASASAILDLAVATGEDLANSATVAASTLRGFQLDASEAARVADVMAKSFSSSALDLEKFKVAMSVVAPVAKTAGLSLEQMTGALSVLVNAGIDASTAGTGLRNILLDTAASGISVAEAFERINNSSNANAEALSLFGKRGATVATVLAQNIEEAQKFALAFDNAGGSAEAMANIMDNTLRGTLLKLRSATEALAISFGQELAPFVSKIATVFSDMALSIRELSPVTKKFLVIFGGIAAAVGPLLALAGTILPAIGTGFALLTGPIGLIAAGLTAIGVIIYRNWEPIKRTLIDIANYFIDLYNEALIFRVAVEGIRTAFQNIYDVGSFVFGTLGDIVSTLAKNMKTAFINVGEAIKAVLTGDFNRLPEILKENFDETTARFKELIKTAKEDFEGLKGTIQGNIEEGVARALGGKKYKLLSDNVDTQETEEKIENTTSKAFQTGVQKGVQELSKQTDLFKGLGTAFRDEFASAFGGRVLNREELDDQFSGYQQSFSDGIDTVQEFKDRSAEILEDSAENFAIGFGNIIGAVASGTAGFGAIGQFLLQTMGDIAINLGKAALRIGITMEALKNAFKVPGLSIAAGIGLIALGQLLKGVASNFAGNFAGGGVVPGTSFSGDRLIAGVNSGELILNIAQQKNLAAAIRSNQAPVILQPSIEFDNRKFRVVLDQVDQRNSRST